MLRNFTIKSRLIFVISFLSLLLVSGGVIGLTSLGAANDALKTSYQNRLVPLSQLDRVVRLIDDSQLVIAQALTAEPAELGIEVERIERTIAEADKVWDAYITTIVSAEELALAQEFAASRARFMQEGVRPAVAALRAQNLQEATALMRGKLVQLSAPMSARMDALMQSQLDRAKTEYERSQTMYLLVRVSCIAGIAFGVLLGAAICIWLVRAIAQPLASAVKVAQSVAAGDLTQVIEVRSSDETGQLLRALRDMNQSLVKIVGDVRAGTETIATASGQIASGNMDLSARTEKQATSLETTASSMEELTSTVKQNADSAAQANQLAMSASEVARKGGAVVSQVVDTMGSINDSAKKIADIISVIDGIAFQTNILALNAAVEAARAGEQGKGFAVVATEVRHLAQRSAAAAKEIGHLIEDSVEKVHAGTRLVDQAGATMNDIVASVRRVTDIMGEITTASREQSAGIEQVNQAIAQMDDVTQQNAALVEESAAAAASLQEQAVSLAQMVSVFKLQDVLQGTKLAVSVPTAALPGSDANPARIAQAFQLRIGDSVLHKA
ncbi:MAG TPA: methyl-accepting chemotaxis protein [Noviherbaspirillum sp.]|nr:methyl-accepting chemotaxis protein [Noviherbaspirillum sp.]